MEKTHTACCALCQINDVNNLTPIKDLRSAVSILRKQMNDNIEVGVSTGNGQTAVFVIVSPGEDVLEHNLITLGFELIHKFNRRKGYPDIGLLKMYIKNL